MALDCARARVHFDMKVSLRGSCSGLPREPADNVEPKRWHLSGRIQHHSELIVVVDLRNSRRPGFVRNSLKEAQGFSQRP